MAKIAGIYANGFGVPVPGVQLVLTARTTSAGVIMTTNAEQATGADGSYSFDVQPGVYVVTASGAYLGVISVCPDSPDGTLNDYLTNFSADELTPAALAEIQELVTEAREQAQSAAASADAAKISENNSAGSASDAKTSEDNAAEYAAEAKTNAEIASTIKSPGDPGTYVFSTTSLFSSTGDKGDIYKGIGYRKAGSRILGGCLIEDPTGETGWTIINHQSVDIAGTWSCCGAVAIGFSITLWLRIDNPDLFKTKLKSVRGQQRVRNCRYANASNTAIDCEIDTVQGWLPFTASPNDSTEYGPKIYAAAIAGDYGDVSEYVSSN
ncbi:prophage tail fiber N-terminal domain-containing protein [Salmonella enterica subsp. enterica serovar Agbeni]|nr:prophage tail fiber N-terminal domain-containing protein [Salmonella enterica subsp. enterica serovar Agbeni]